MGIFSKSDLDLAEPHRPRWLSLMLLLIIFSAALTLAWRAPSLNNKLFNDNKNAIPLTGSLWILILPETGGGGEVTGKTLLKTSEASRPGASRTEEAPGMMYISRFKDGLIRPQFFFNNLPQVGPADKQLMLAFRYQIDDSTERKAMAVVQGRQVLMVLPVKGDFEDLGPSLLAEAARGQRLRVELELRPDWIFEASYDVSEMVTALDQFKKDRQHL